MSDVSESEATAEARAEPQSGAQNRACACPVCKEPMQSGLASIPGRVKCCGCGLEMDPRFCDPVERESTDARIEELWGKSVSDNYWTTRTIKSAEREQAIREEAAAEKAAAEGASAAAEASGTMPNQIKRKVVVKAGEGLDDRADFLITKTLGEGGMGVVYAARQSALNRTVALKMIKAAQALNSRLQSKFLREATIVGDLDHPNICPVYDLGSDSRGHLFCAMKQVKGQAWLDVFRDRSRRDNLEAFNNVLDAIAYAHNKRIIHRDIKLENVMLGPFGEVLVMDWGLATFVALDGSLPQLTDVAAAGGTPAYMAPEMANGDKSQIGFQTDIYLLGAMLFELIAGRPPHAGNNALECIANASVNRIVDVEGGGELMEIALQAMATDPADRYQCVAAFQAALDGYRAHAESITLCEQAEKQLMAAQRSGSYDEFNRALFGFQEALELWPENATADTGVYVTRLYYVERAYDKGDLDLAASLLKEPVPENHVVLQKKRANFAARVGERIREREARRFRGRVFQYATVVMLAILLIFLPVAMWRNQAAQRRLQNQKQNAETALARCKEAQEAGTEALYGLALLRAMDRLRLGRGEMAARILAEAPASRRGWEHEWLSRLAAADVAAGRPEPAMEGAPFQRAAIDESGRYAVLWSRAAGIRWRGADDRVRRPAVGGALEEIRAIAVSPRGARAMVGTADGSTSILDLESGAVERVMLGHDAPVTAAAYHAEQDLAATGDRAGVVKLRRPSTAQEIRAWRLPDPVRRLIFSTHGGRLVAILEGAKGPRLAALVVDDGTVAGRIDDLPAEGPLAFASDDRTLYLGPRALRVDGRRWTLGEPVLPADTRATALAVTPDRSRLLVGDAAGEVRVVDLATGAPVLGFLTGGSKVLALAAPLDGQGVTVVDEDGRRWRWTAPEATGAEAKADAKGE